MISPVIAAVASGHVKAAIGVIRLSGDDTLSVLSRVFTPCRPIVWQDEPRRMVYGAVRDAQGGLLDWCMAVYFRPPASYTGECAAELYCHGGTAVLDAVLDALFKAGARPAAPGEYTKRAFLNGKLDLFSAEAVIDLIDADSSAAVKNAAAQLQSGASQPIRQLRSSLLSLMANFYAEVDFPDEGVPPLADETVLQTLSDVSRRLSVLLSGCERGRIVKDGFSVALIGRPNAGKSSLLNALCGSDRAIVTQVPGTTRDVLDEKFIYNDTVFRLLDTAGVRSTDDPVEQIGVDRAYRALMHSSACLLLFDGSVPPGEDDFRLLAETEGKPRLLVRTKADLPAADLSRLPPLLPVSTVTGEGLDTLCKQLVSLVEETSGISPEAELLISNERQADALRRASESVDAALAAAKNRLSFDLILSDVELAADALGEITGESTPEDVLNDLFSRFCVGK